MKLISEASVGTCCNIWTQGRKQIDWNGNSGEDSLRSSNCRILHVWSVMPSLCAYLYTFTVHSGSSFEPGIAICLLHGVPDLQEYS